MELDIYFLLFTLFFPRLTLIVYLLQDWYPKNSVPIWGDVLLGVFVPRILVLIYIYQSMGAENVWFITHLVVLIMTYFGGGTGTVWHRRRRGDDV